MLDDLFLHCDALAEDSYAVQAGNPTDDKGYIALSHIYGRTFMLLSSLLANEVLALSDNVLDMRDVNRLEPVLQSMIIHPEKLYSLEDAANMANMSYHNFSRTFKRMTGLSFVDYQNILRIRYAEALLKNQENSITQVAEQTNFGSLSYFNRVFKSINGLSPSEYRRRHRAK